MSNCYTDETNTVKRSPKKRKRVMSKHVSLNFHRKFMDSVVFAD